MRANVEEIKVPAELGLCYSLHPPGSYTRVDPNEGYTIGIGREFALHLLSQPAHALAAWNLYWLSDPLVDRLLVEPFDPGSGINLEMCAACWRAIPQTVGDRTLQDLLVHMRPAELVQHIRAHPHGHLEPYKLKAEEWIATISVRSQEYRGIHAREGNVVHVTFRGRSSS